MKYFYYQVIPITKIPIEKKPYFTYKSKEDIPFGSFVLIPFARKKIKGIVLKKQTKPTFRTREITKVKTPSLINKPQLQLAENISDHYFTPVGVVLKFFTFNTTKKIPELKAPTTEKDKEIELTQKQLEVTDFITKGSAEKFLVFGPASSGKTEIAMALIKKSLTEGTQSLVVLPEIFLSYQEIYRYQKRFAEKKVVLFHSKLKPSEKSAIWQGVKSGEIDILITTKTGLFMPFKNLGTIIIDEEQDISHKNWDQNPKYHAGKVAGWLSKQHSAKLVFLSATPSVKNFWKANEHKQGWKRLNLPALKTEKIKVAKPNIKIIDLWEKKYQRNGDILFCNDLLGDMRSTLNKNKISLILVPYHGKSQAVFCEKCKTSLKCPKCETSLIHTKDTYQCLHCNHKISSLSSCPECKSYKLKNIGFGTESVASEIKKRFPESKIGLVDRTNFENNSSREALFEDIRENKIDFLVGNQTVAKGFDFPNIDLVAILNAQRWTGKADYKFDERWLGGLFQVGGRLNRPTSSQKGILYIQSFKTNLDILENLKKWDWEKFVKKELETRKALKYPPFKKLYRLTFRDPNKDKVEKNTKKVYNQLQECLKKEGFEIFEPYYSFVKKKGFFWNKHILIKTNLNQDPTVLNKNLKKISNNWSIDPDPENIF